MQYKIGVVGDIDSIMLFSMFGFDTCPVEEPKDARFHVDRMAKEGYGVIYVTEQIAKDIPDTLSRYHNAMSPVVILIPGKEGSLGIGLQGVQDTVEKAVGQNIL